MTRIHSYVVRYDSGFAPNPFYSYCTLATCKPSIRRSADIGDWVVGSGSNDRSVRRGGHLVYAMRVTEAMTFDEYGRDPRFESKKPYRNGSRKQSCGDNIYFRVAAGVAGSMPFPVEIDSTTNMTVAPVFAGDRRHHGVLR